MTAGPLGFIHQFVPSRRQDSSLTLLMLHGTGGDERDLLSLGQALAPDAALLSPRGKVLENGMPRFFRRLAEGVFDLEDLRFRTLELAEFIKATSAFYHFDPAKVIAVGYSNGANIAASLLLLHPSTLLAAILFHAMVPLVPESPPDLSDKKILITAGEKDPIVRPEEAERLAELFRSAGADVSLRWQAGGHQLSGDEVQAARQWLSAL